MGTEERTGGLALVERVATGAVGVDGALEQLTSIDELDPVLHLSGYRTTVAELVARWWCRHVAGGGDVDPVLAWAGQRDVPDEVLHVLAPDVAWQLRARGEAPPERTSGAEPEVYLAALLHLHTARFDFRPGAMARLLDVLPATLRDRPAVTALRVFADLNGTDDERRAAAAATIDAGDWGTWLPDAKLAHVVLHGLWLASDEPGNARRALALGGWMQARFGGDANLHYRLAWAYRVEGRLEEAKTSIERAIDALGPGQAEIHQDYTRERELILASMQIRAFVDEHLDEVRELIREEGRRADRRVRDSLVGIIEILGLFTTVIFFVLGTGTVAVRAESPRELLVSGAIIFAFVTGLFVMFRLAGGLDVTALARSWARRRRDGSGSRRRRRVAEQ